MTCLDLAQYVVCIMSTQVCWYFVNSLSYKMSEERFLGMTCMHSSKVKVMSLCFNWAPCHEGMLGEWRYSASHSLTLALPRWRVGTFMPWPLYPQVKSPWYPLDRRLGGPQSWSGHGGDDIIFHGLLFSTLDLEHYIVRMYIQKTGKVHPH
jgi:hypothetical protein